MPKLFSVLSKTFIIKHPVVIAVSVIIILGFLAYGNSLNGKFIWDDYVLVHDNVYIRSYSNISKVFFNNFAAGAEKKDNPYRPLQTFSYMLDYSLWKLDARGYHLSNILWHILAALSIYWLINLLFGDKLLSFCTSVLFLLHPVHTEAVAYISGRSDSLALLFMLLCFILYLKYLQQKKILFFSLMLLSYILALLSRENSLILPLLLLLYHYTFKERINAKQFLAILIIASAYILLRLSAVLKEILFFNSYPAFSTTLWQRLPGSLAALTKYLTLLFSPFQLHMEYGRLLFGLSNPRVLGGLLILALLLILAFVKRKTNKLVFFSIGWFLLALLPVSNLYPINAYMAEHWLYLPSIGFFLILAGLICYIFREKKYPLVAGVSLFLLASFYSYLTIKQNNFWQEQIVFYEYTLKYSPLSPRLYNNLAVAYQQIGEYEKALSLYKKAIALDSANAGLYNNLAAYYRYLGKDKEVALLLQKAITLDPTNALLYNNLATVYRGLNKENEAFSLLKKAQTIDPSYAQTYNNLAVFYHQQGKYQPAIELYKKAIALNPAYFQAYNNLASTYRCLGRNAEAACALKKAIALNPAYAEAYNNLALCYFDARQYKLAIKYFNQAQKLGLSNPQLAEQLKSQR